MSLKRNLRCWAVVVMLGMLAVACGGDQPATTDTSTDAAAEDTPSEDVDAEATPDEEADATDDDADPEDTPTETADDEADSVEEDAVETGDPIDLTGREATEIADTDGLIHLQNETGRAEDKCLEGQGGAAPGSGAVLDGGAFMNICQNVSGQMWRLVPQDNGYYRLQNRIGEAEGLCLEGNAEAEGSVLGGASIMDRCQDVSGQMWRFVDADNGAFYLQTQFLEGDNKCFQGQSGAAVDGDATLDGAAFMQDCQEVPGQWWQLVPLEQQAPQEPQVDEAEVEAEVEAVLEELEDQAEQDDQAAQDDEQSPAHEFEARVIELANEERARAGCDVQFVPNDVLRRTALKHSIDMALNDYFSHYGLDGSEPGDRLAREGYTDIGTGENIAVGQGSPEDVMRAWMNSPGHRAGILNCQSTQMSIGYYFLENDTGRVNFNHYWTQMFGREA